MDSRQADARTQLILPKFECAVQPSALLYYHVSGDRLTAPSFLGATVHTGGAGARGGGLRGRREHRDPRHEGAGSVASPPAGALGLWLGLQPVIPETRFFFFLFFSLPFLSRSERPVEKANTAFSSLYYFLYAILHTVTGAPGYPDGTVHIAGKPHVWAARRTRRVRRRSLSSDVVGPRPADFVTASAFVVPTHDQMAMAAGYRRMADVVKEHLRAKMQSQQEDGREAVVSAEDIENMFRDVRAGAGSGGVV